MMDNRQVVALIADFLGHEPDEVVLDIPLGALVADSFALVELAIHLQQESGIALRHEDLAAELSVREFVQLFEVRHGH